MRPVFRVIATVVALSLSGCGAASQSLKPIPSSHAASPAATPSEPVSSPTATPASPANIVDAASLAIELDELSYNGENYTISTNQFSKQGSSRSVKARPRITGILNTSK